MGLKQYKEKRNFDATPEPNTGTESHKDTLRFVVQRHEASHLHYDFRLEMDGVYKSWAVPKGPSMVAGEKRLAMMVEDHPLAYGKFYGEIPKGNYGAGTVEIWDKGTYEPIGKTKNAAAKAFLSQLQKGDIKFILHGQHLNGTFALVQMKNQKNDNSWLLIKKKDEFSVDTYHIEEIVPLKSKKRTSKNSSTKKPEKENPKASENIEQAWKRLKKPMLAKLSDELKDNSKWFYELKYDGYRALTKVAQKVDMRSRNDKSFTLKYKPLSDELATVQDEVILDGEVVIEDKKGRSNFQLLQNYDRTKEGTLLYYVFDILYVNGHDITSFPLFQRKEILETFFKNNPFQHILKADYVHSSGKKLYAKLAKEGEEGIIAKDGNSSYLPGKRTNDWLKIKTSRMQEAVICGYTAPQNSRKHFGSLILGLYENDMLVYIGNCGTGFSDASLQELFTQMNELETDKAPFSEKISHTRLRGKPTWLKPQLVCQIKFQGWTQEQHMRIPVFMGLREDKSAIDVKRESAEKKTMEKNEEKVFAYGNKKVKVSHWEKLYWPKEKISKGRLVEYYQTIAPYILPYLKDRPLSLNRYTNGIEEQNFYQKDMQVEHIPSWLKTAKIYSKSNEGYIDYLICNNEATLIYMVNLGCIEINPWHSRYRKEEYPDYLMMDLDPGKIDFRYVVDTALTIKKICDELQIPCYCKTSGATGLHVFIPLAATYTYDEVKLFAELLARLTHTRLPKFTSIERSISKRKDKIYVDFLQNRKGQTIASAYSARPKPGATVSAPLHWDEVTHKLSPRQFTIFNMPARIQAVGDLWKEILGKGINLKKILTNLSDID